MKNHNFANNSATTEAKKICTEILDVQTNQSLLYKIGHQFLVTTNVCREIGSLLNFVYYLGQVAYQCC
jgi:hypothetical protein